MERAAASVAADTDILLIDRPWNGIGPNRETSRSKRIHHRPVSRIFFVVPLRVIWPAVYHTIYIFYIFSVSKF